MPSLHGFIAVIVALAVSSSALAQSPDEATDAPRPLEQPPGYGDPLPKKREDWELLRSTLRARVERAERELESAKDFGDEAHELRVEAELDARQHALKRFEERTMARNPAAVAAGATLIGVGLLGIWVASINSMNHDEPLESSKKAGLITLGVFSGVFVAGGIPLIVVGARKTWNGPSDASAATTVVVAANRLALRGSF
jgi:hypothetical protein